MSRYLTALLAGLVVAGAVHAKPVSIRWHGQSFFEITTGGGTRFVTDPHAIDVYGRKSVTADAITVSHFHTDHTRIGVVENWQKLRENNMIFLGLKDPKGDGKRFEWNDIDAKVKDTRLRTVGVYHDSSQGLDRGKVSVFIFEVDGLRIVHLGDLGHMLSDEQIKKIGPVDVLMIPVGGVYTLNGTEAKQVVAQLKPTRYIIPMHCGTRVYDELLTADEFLDGQKNVKRLDTNELLVDPAAAKPAAPTIVVPHWASK
jgi:L-ascorbate metabolism protein UlaG (beta-lactamase superfamily)